jgi:hypothetical protein
MAELKSKHPRFQGNWEDLRQFQLLASSPIRSQAREDALRSWERYKLERQLAVVGRALTKGTRMWAMINRVIDLTGATLDEICVGSADLRGVILDECSLRGAWLKGANLENASLRGVVFSANPNGERGAGRLLYSSLCGADLTGADLSGVDLSFADLNDTTLSGANLSDANLSHVSLVRAAVDNAILRNTRIYGIAAWDLRGNPSLQQDLIITPEATLGDKKYYHVLRESRISQLEEEHLSIQSPVTVDNIKVAQFVYLLLNNQEIRDVIDTITSKAVLILGRFSKERKPVLDALRDALRSKDFLPIVFDFERPKGRDFTETIKVLAGMSCFVIADITNPKSSPLELQATVPDYMIPFVPILQEGESAFAMFVDLQNKHDWALTTRTYNSCQELIQFLDDAVINPALEKRRELEIRKVQTTPARRVSDYSKHQS